MQSDFTSEQQSLDWVIQSISDLTASKLHIQAGPEQAELIIASSAMVRVGLAYANAISILLKEIPEASSPLERALYELWIEFQYLLRIGKPTDNAKKLMINVVFEIDDFTKNGSTQYTQTDIDGIRNCLAFFRQKAPRLYNKVHQQRYQPNRPQYHWSGLSRSRMEKAVLPNSKVYQMLS